MNKDDVLIQAVKTAKESQFKLTGIKVELEIVFGRGNHRSVLGCDACSDGRVACPRCDRGGCSRCFHRGYTNCKTCVKRFNPRDTKSVNDELLRRLLPLKLARKLKASELSDYGYVYTAKDPMVFAKTYNDVTVDTEFTFTLSMADPKTVLLLPKILEAFYSLKDKFGQEPSIHNAGMHITLLKTANAGYPRGDHTQADALRFKNFKKSMVLLLPALYFLSSANDKARSLGYRQPRIAPIHTSAINFLGQGLEFRTFEPCFDNPSMILDDVVVALNCLKFFTKKYTRNHLAKITTKTYFGCEGSNDLKRLYVTTEHIDLLNRGLRMIKPSYLTVTEIKQQRGFKTTKRDLKSREVVALQRAQKEYELYEQRFSWSIVTTKNNYIRRYMDDLLYREQNNEVPRPYTATLESELLEQARVLAEPEVDRFTKSKEPKTAFCQKQLAKFLKAGDFELNMEVN